MRDLSEHVSQPLANSHSDRVAELEAEVAQLRDSKALSQALLERSADCVKILDLDGRLSSMNGPGMCLMEIDDFCSFEGQEWTSLWPEALRPDMRRALDEARAGGVGRFYGFCPTAKGTPKWWDVQVSPIVGSDGQQQALLSVSRDVTERARAEEAMRDNSRRFDAILNNTREAVFLMDHHQHCVYANAAAEKLTGYRLAEMQGRPLHDVVHHKRPDGSHYPLEECPIDRAFPERAQMSGEETFVHKDGSFYPVAFTASPVLDEDGNPVGTVIEARGIAEEKAAEAARRETEERYRLAARATNDAIWDWRLADGHVIWNDALADLFGHQLTETSADWWLEHIHPDDRERIGHDIHAVIDGTGTSWTAEYRFRCADGSYADVLDRGFVLRDGSGHAVRMIGAMLDLTERRRAEVALQEAEERLRLAVDNADVGLWDVDMVNDVLIWPPRTKAMFGISADVPVSMQDFYDGLHPDDREATSAAFAAAADPARRALYDVEYRTVGKEDGLVRWVAAKGRGVFDGTGPDALCLRVVGTALDVTSRKRAEAELLEFNEHLERRVAEEIAERAKTEEALRQAQKMEAVGQLTGGIAHDFNNLLTGVIGSLDMMQRRLAKGETDRIERYATAAITSANRAAALTHRLLAFSRRQPLDPKPVNANRLVTGMEELLRRTIGESVRLEIVTAGGLWQTRCDPHQLESSILNLAINARDAMPEGGTLTIETCNAHLDNAYTAMLRDVRPGQYVCICVTDTGIGMDKATIEKAFEPFFTTKPIGQGTGLGLSMIYGFARQSEGYAKIYSEVGKGTTIKLYLPRYYGEGEDAEDALAGMSEEHWAGHGEVVVVVEDETGVRDLVVDVLQELGYRAVEASDGPSGLKLLQTDMRVDLLITDVGLPGLNGRQVADAAREHRPNLKVLFMTGYAENATLANGFLEPGMQMITKPFAIDALATRIRDMIETLDP